VSSKSSKSAECDPTMSVGADTSVYVHFPWCLKRCPYCDFTTRKIDRGDLPHATYADAVVREAGQEADAVSPGNVAVIVPPALLEATADAFARAGVEIGRATRSGLEARITLVPVDLVKGLELDAAVVVEPAAIVESGPKGLRALYVALTRATQRLAIVHARPLPPALVS
jgi:hypothetical protein